jgi:hypothetical protein
MGKSLSFPTLSGKKKGKKMKGGVPARNKGDELWADILYFVVFGFFCYGGWKLVYWIYQFTKSVAAVVSIIVGWVVVIYGVLVWPWPLNQMKKPPFGIRPDN